MNILVFCQYYYPEPFRISDICEELVKRGHSITVVTGEPNYPEGEVYKGYENHIIQKETINGVKIIRCPIIPRKKGVAYRLLNYFSYPYHAKKIVRKGLPHDSGKPFDIAFVNQLSPVMMAEPALLYKRKYGVPVALYCLDLWPESLVAGGIGRTSPVFKVFHAISKKIYTKADRIMVSSRGFCSYLAKEFGISAEMMEYLPQYAEDSFSYIGKNDKKDNVINLLFAGNIGAAQSVQTILEAAEKLKGEPVLFHIVGGGVELESLKELAEKKALENVRFYGRRPVEDMPDFYDMADAMLVTLKDDPALSQTLPGKVQSYMAAGKPVIGAISGETKAVIDDAACGFCGPAEDSGELAKNIKKFIDYEEKEELGKQAKNYYNMYFKKEVFLGNLEAVFAALTK